VLDSLTCHRGKAAANLLNLLDRMKHPGAPPSPDADQIFAVRDWPHIRTPV